MTLTGCPINSVNVGLILMKFSYLQFSSTFSFFLLLLFSFFSPHFSAYWWIHKHLVSQYCNQSKSKLLNGTCFTSNKNDPLSYMNLCLFIAKLSCNEIFSEENKFIFWLPSPFLLLCPTNFLISCQKQFINFLPSFKKTPLCTNFQEHSGWKCR